MAVTHSPGFVRLVESIRPTVKELTVGEAQQRLASDPTARLVDVREDGEWEVGHAAGAVHLARGVLERDIEARVPDPATPLLLYCGGGYRSVLAADALQRMGYTQVYSIVGGWRAWVAADAPTVVPGNYAT
jgi:rhodanese-related sulfurtransferase